MNVATRKALISDCDFARAVHHQAYREVVERQFGPWDEKAQDQFFAGDWAAGGFEIVSLDGVPCGYLCIEPKVEVIFVHEIVLLPEFQGRGIGSAVLNGVLNKARQQRASVQLGTFRMNRAVGLYLKLGFREIGRTETHILMAWTSPIP